MPTSMRKWPNTISFSLNSMPHGAATAKNSLQNTLLLPENSPKETLHSALLRLMSPKTRSLERDSESRVSQPSNSSRAEPHPIMKEEELRMLSSTTLSRSLDLHPTLLIVMVL